MANYKSTQVTIADDTQSSLMLKANEYTGRQRISYFQYTVPAGGILIADTLELCDIPAGARIINGRVHTTAFGAGCTLAIGIVGTAAKYMAATSIAAISQTDFANTLALFFGEEQLTQTRMVGTFAGANPPAAANLAGFIEWVLD